MSKIPHVKEGDLITDALYNAVAERLERCMNLAVAPGSGLVMVAGPRGKALGLSVPHHIWGKLTGSSSPYDWVEVMPDASGVFSAFGNRGKAANAYEINSKAGLNGKVVQLWWTAAGDMRFVYQGVGSVCDWDFTFVGCTGGGISGVVVVLTQGSTTIATGTTDGSGNVTFASLPVGTYTVTATPPSGSGFAVLTSTRGHTCVGGAPQNAGTITLAADTGFTCSTCCNLPIPTTLSTSDGNGTHALTWNGTGAWVSAWIDSGFPGSSLSDGFGCCLDAGNCQYQITLSCSTGTWTLAVTWGNTVCAIPGGSNTSCLNGTQIRTYTGGQASGSLAEDRSPTGTCHPLSLTFSIPTNDGFLIEPTSTPGGGGTMMVTP